MLRNVLEPAVMQARVITRRTLQSNVRNKVYEHHLAIPLPWLVSVAPVQRGPTLHLILHHAHPYPSVLRARVYGCETSAVEVTFHRERGALGEVEADDGKGESDSRVGVFLLLFPWQRNFTLSFRGDVVGHEFLARLISHRRRFRKRPRQRFKVSVVPHLEQSLRLYLFLFGGLGGIAAFFSSSSSSPLILTFSVSISGSGFNPFCSCSCSYSPQFDSPAEMIVGSPPCVRVDGCIIAGAKGEQISELFELQPDEERDGGERDRAEVEGRRRFRLLRRRRHAVFNGDECTNDNYAERDEKWVEKNRGHSSAFQSLDPIQDGPCTGGGSAQLVR